MTGTAVAVALAGCGGSGSDGGGGGDGGGGDGGGSDDTEEPESSGGGEEFGGWFDNVSNYDGVDDRTGSDEVTVSVGAGSDGFLFDPPAIRVSSGTTVVWEWTDKGGAHNVVADDGSYESELVGEEGHTFEQTFEESGTSKYFCRPHKGMGMKGVVVVE